jgi:hypothetical protein
MAIYLQLAALLIAAILGATGGYTWSQHGVKELQTAFTTLKVESKANEVLVTRLQAKVQETAASAVEQAASAAAVVQTQYDQFAAQHSTLVAGKDAQIAALKKQKATIIAQPAPTDDAGKAELQRRIAELEQQQATLECLTAKMPDPLIKSLNSIGAQ